jgi:hypothetical protein
LKAAKWTLTRLSDEQIAASAFMTNPLLSAQVFWFVWPYVYEKDGSACKGLL